MIPLRKVCAGQYETLDGKYLIEHQDGHTECSHPLCDTLHRDMHPGDDLHIVKYVSWHVWDNERDDYAMTDYFTTKREAHQWLDMHIDKEGKR